MIRPLRAQLPCRPLAVATTLVAALACGCGDGSQADGGPSSTVISLPLSLQTLPWDDAALKLDVSTLAVRIGDPAPLTAGTGSGSIAWSEVMAVPASSCSVVEGQRRCSLTLPNLETEGLSQGLMIEAADSRQAYSTAAWQNLSTLVSQASLVALRGQPAPAAGAVPAAIMSTAGTTQLATWSGISRVTCSTRAPSWASSQATPSCRSQAPTSQAQAPPSAWSTPAQTSPPTPSRATMPRPPTS